jgi:LuxR family transcriptional regulator, maltose regulon positive regulatory protein
MAKTATHGAGDRGARSGGELALPLAEAKLAVPASRRHVDRPRVRQALAEGRQSALTLVAAPAGYGKTTAVHAWSESLDAALAWVTLDAGDNDPIRLWTYIATAVDRVREGLGRTALQQLSVSASVNERFLDALMNGLAAFAEPLVLVLDDLHAVTEPECLAAIDYALERLPANARLVAITRSDPALRLAQLRAEGKLKEVRAAELAFTVAEARELLVEHFRVELGEEEIALLAERAEGWPAVLVLAGLWLQSVANPTRAVREFGGTHRFVAEYLSNEVFASLDDDLRSFLQEIAVLGRFTAELCADALERPDAASVLTELERSNLFLERLERGGWFRVHSLFAEFAVARLASIEPAAAERIHKKAAAWFKSRGLAVEAIEHAAAAGDHESVAQLLDDYHLLLIRTGATRTLLRWIDTLPDGQLATHPDLAVAAATAAMLVGHSTIEQRRFLQLAERALAPRPDGSNVYSEVAIRMVRATTADTGVGPAVRDGRRAVELAQEDADELLTAALAGYAPSTSRVSSTRHGRQRCAFSSIPTPSDEHRATRLPARLSRSSRSSAGRSRPPDATTY